MTTPARLEKTSPEPTPWKLVAAKSCQVSSCHSAIEAKEAGAGERPGHDHDASAERFHQPCGREPHKEAGNSGGQQQVPGLGDGGAEPVAGLRWRLQELRQEAEGRVHAEADEAGDDVRSRPRAGASCACRSVEPAPGLEDDPGGRSRGRALRRTGLAFP